MAVTGVTVMVAVPTLVESWDEAALIETVVLVFTAGAVNKPLLSMVPALAPQITEVVKLPVPVTVDVQELVWPDCTEVGVHDTVTAVMVAVLEPLPPHAMIPSRENKARIRARTRKPFPQTKPAQHPYCSANEYLTDKPLA